MIRLAVKFAYMGDGFCGSQIQPGCRTVEGEMLSALGKVSGDCDPCLRIASRTDKGVNALGNVAAVSTELEPHTLLRALNAVSDGVFYRSFAVVDDSFNPRLASGREYRYILPSEGLDADLARECAAAFTGEHDFAGLCRPDGKPTVVTVDSIDVSEEDDLLVLTYRARYFLWNMVRRTAAAISSVASGRSSVDDVRAALEGGDSNFGIARPDALTLTDVRYDGIDFTPSGSEVLSSRVSEGIFSSGLASSFYRSL